MSTGVQVVHIRRYYCHIIFKVASHVKSITLLIHRPPYLRHLNFSVTLTNPESKRYINGVQFITFLCNLKLTFISKYSIRHQNNKIAATMFASV